MGDAALADQNFGAGAGILGGAGATNGGIKRTETAELDAVAFGQGIDDAAEENIDDFFNVLLHQMGILGGNFID